MSLETSRTTLAILNIIYRRRIEEGHTSISIWMLLCPCVESIDCHGRNSHAAPPRTPPFHVGQAYLPSPLQMQETNQHDCSHPCVVLKGFPAFDRAADITASVPYFRLSNLLKCDAKITRSYILPAIPVRRIKHSVKPQLPSCSRLFRGSRI